MSKHVRNVIAQVAMEHVADGRDNNIPQSNPPKEEISTLQNIKSAPTSILLATAGDIVINQVSQSQLLLDSSQEMAIPRFDKKEIHLGRRLIGHGGFCIASEVSKIKLKKARKETKTSQRSPLLSRVQKMVDGHHHSKSSDCPSEQTGSLSTSEHDTIEDENPSDMDGYSRDYVANFRANGRRYVLKQLDPDLKKHDKVKFFKGVVSLAMEAKYLSCLDHPNIIDIFGDGECGPFDEGYFILLEMVTERLPGRLKKWGEISKRCKEVNGEPTGSHKKLLGMQFERLEASFHICRALGYLHRKNIVFRGLKPETVGFDQNGVLKLFEFGIAREMSQADQSKDGLYQMTGLVGTPRYMSPEVGLSKCYNELTDVYSWSMVMWFIMALEPPFLSYTSNMIVEHIFLGGSRPDMPTSWPENIRKVMEKAWHSDIASRPSFLEISSVLRDEIKVVEAQQLE